MKTNKQWSMLGRTFLSSGVSWPINMLMLSEFHTQSWLLKYSSRLMALCRRLKMRIILKRTAGSQWRSQFYFVLLELNWIKDVGLTVASVHTDAGRGRRWRRGTCGWPGSSTGRSGSWRWCWRWVCGRPAPEGFSWRLTSRDALQNKNKQKKNNLEESQLWQKFKIMCISFFI